MSKVALFTDGACRGNPGPGAWGVLIRSDNKEKRLSGTEKYTTNNRMELMAVLRGLQALKSSCHVDLTTDSQYVRLGMTEWLPLWKKRNWKTSESKPVKNRDLWEQLDQEASHHHVKWHWVKSHSGHPENEIADSLARAAIDNM